MKRMCVYPFVFLMHSLICHAGANELVSHLPLQMLLYFNLFYFPCWWFSAVFMLEVKVLVSGF